MCQALRRALRGRCLGCPDEVLTACRGSHSPTGPSRSVYTRGPRVFLAVSTPEDMATLHWMDDEGSPHPNFSSAIRLLEDIKPLQFDLRLPVAHSATEAWMFGEEISAKQITHYQQVQRLNH